MIDKVSVIIPVYNSEKYLDECIQSLLRQTYMNLELIFIDDGSIDGSLDIIKSYSINFEKIKYFKQKNQGPSSARNNGIAESSGEFICFVDSDDCIKENMIEELITKIKEDNSDIVLCDFSFKYKEYERYQKTLIDCTKGKVDLLVDMLIEGDSLNSQCNKLYRSNIIRKNNIRFNNNLKMGEDQIFNLNYIRYCDEFSYINKSFYLYRVVKESTCRKIHQKQIEMLVEQEKIRNEIIESFEINKRTKLKFKAAKWYLKTISAYCFLAINTLSNKESGKFLEKSFNLEETKRSLKLTSGHVFKYDSAFNTILVFIFKSRSKKAIEIISKSIKNVHKLKSKIIRR